MTCLGNIEVEVSIGLWHKRSPLIHKILWKLQNILIGTKDTLSKWYHQLSAKECSVWPGSKWSINASDREDNQVKSYQISNNFQWGMTKSCHHKHVTHKLQQNYFNKPPHLGLSKWSDCTVLSSVMPRVGIRHEGGIEII